jgi:thiamine biosynthesis lipoprotein
MIVRLATHAMGTRFEIVLEGDDLSRVRPIGEAALEAIGEWEQRLSLFSAHSFLSYINANAFDRPIRLDDDMFELLTACADVHEASGGAFDATVAPLMKAWGFHGEGGDVDTARASIGMDGVELDHEQRTIRFTRPGMKLDLGAIGKGHALDDAARIVRENGIERALLHGGTSTAIAIGAPPGEQGWRIALATHDRSPVATLRDAALAVSAPTGRMIEVEGGRLGHVLDPRTGNPTNGASLTAVIAPSACMADAWSTALLVLGEHPPGMPTEYTTYIEREAEGNVHRAVAGAQPHLISVPDCRDRATEEAA